MNTRAPKPIRIALGSVAGLFLLMACGPSPQTPPPTPSVPTPAPGPSREPAQPPNPKSTTPTSETLETALTLPSRALPV